MQYIYKIILVVLSTFTLALAVTGCIQTASFTTITSTTTISSTESLSQQIHIILGGIVGLVGLFMVLSTSGMLKKKLDSKFSWLSFGIGLAGLGLFIIASANSYYASAFGALATIAIAGLILLLAKQNNDESLNNAKKIRLQEVLKWAQELGVTILSIEHPPIELHVRTNINDFIRANTFLNDQYDKYLNDFTALRMKSVFIGELIKEDKDIYPLIELLIKYLKLNLKLIHSYKDNDYIINTADRKIKAAINIARNEDKIYSSVVKLLEKIGSESLS